MDNKFPDYMTHISTKGIPAGNLNLIMAGRQCGKSSSWMLYHAGYSKGITHTRRQLSDADNVERIKAHGDGNKLAVVEFLVNQTAHTSRSIFDTGFRAGVYDVISSVFSSTQEKSQFTAVIDSLSEVNGVHGFNKLGRAIRPNKNPLGVEIGYIDEVHQTVRMGSAESMRASVRAGRFKAKDSMKKNKDQIWRKGARW